MTYHLIIPEPIEHEISKRLDSFMILRLNKKMRKLKTAPDVYGKPLRMPLAGMWEIRFEKRWRVLYKIDYHGKIVTIVGFKHKDEM